MKLKWFFVYNESSTLWFNQLIRRSVASAIRFNPEFSAHCIYDGNETELTRWMADKGVHIHKAEVPFKARLSAPDVVGEHSHFKPAYRPDLASGAYLKLLIPEFCEPGDDFVLYTDCDTMFLNPCDFSAIKPATLAAVPEISGDSFKPQETSERFNSGVMILNVDYFKSQRDEALRILEERKYYFRGNPGFYDQGLYNVMFKGLWEVLDPTWNWRSYWEPRDDIKVLHYHGPKPLQVQRHLAGGDPGALPHITKMIDDHIDFYRAYENRIADLKLDTGGY